MNMENIYITGHKNPDMDSICSAYAYACLKNQTDKNNNYIPVRCGHLTDSLKKQFEMLGVTPPPYKKDVRPKVSDVILAPLRHLEADQPIYDLIKYYDASLPSVVPVFNGDDFYGLLSIDDISAWFLNDNMGNRPEYVIKAANAARVTGGAIIYDGSSDAEAEGPLIVGSAAFDYFCKAIKEFNNPIVVLPFNEKYVRFAMENGASAIIICACSEEMSMDFSGYNGWVVTTGMDTAETLRRVRMAPCVSCLVGEQGPSLQAGTFYEEAKAQLSDSKLRGLSVFENDRWAGFVTRRCFLKKPHYKVILMDHNEAGQSIGGIEEADVMEIIDHHRLDALKTDMPIFVCAEPLGSTCTIVYRQYMNHNVIPEMDAAKMMLAGIMSDTLILQSPTTTEADREAAGKLAEICGISDIQEFGRNLFSHNDTLGSMEPSEAIRSDFKIYSKSGIRVGIGQCETMTLKDVEKVDRIYLDALETERVKNGLDWALLMITDVIEGDSVLLSTDCRLKEKLTYEKIMDCIFDMKGVMSRKKQLLPEVLHACG